MKEGESHMGKRGQIFPIAETIWAHVVAKNELMVSCEWWRWKWPRERVLWKGSCHMLAYRLLGKRIREEREVVGSKQGTHEAVERRRGRIWNVTW